MKKETLFATATLFLIPVLSYAVPQNLGELIGEFLDLINPILALLTGLAVMYFIFGIVKYIKNAGDAKAAGEGKSIMLYGVFALFILFSFWGIVQFIHSDIFG